ncbi:unnamed protein product [Parascedosporium putredinis]|uniref:Uncharacterized protein n=1 Tax=Parascedosporium putredinis TaxID=1442378 RepID=A0A9P1M8B5_9PEZI|nr:unnamed protein product [Parascedosporium putredinis]CAI7988596.1 unnamed protein product [Parascedosporium putredinis]
MPSKKNAARYDRVCSSHAGTVLRSRFEGRPEMRRELYRGSFVGEVVKWMLNHGMGRAFFWLEHTEVDGVGWTQTVSTLDKTEFIAATVMLIGIMAICFAPFCLVSFGVGHDKVFTGVALAICGIVVATFLYGGQVGVGSVIIGLTYMTVLFSSISERLIGTSS